MKFGKLQVVDTIHVVADANIGKDKRRQREGGKARDRDATWGTKGDKVVVNRDGKQEKRAEYFYGYKDQVSLNAKTEMITSVKPGYGDEYDGRWLPYLIQRDMNKEIEVGTVAADRGYDDGEKSLFPGTRRDKVSYKA